MLTKIERSIQLAGCMIIVGNAMPLTSVLMNAVTANPF
jgi:histidinol dehydrogenase